MGGGWDAVRGGCRRRPAWTSLASRESCADSPFLFEESSGSCWRRSEGRAFTCSSGEKGCGQEVGGGRQQMVD